MCSFTGLRKKARTCSFTRKVVWKISAYSQKNNIDGIYYVEFTPTETSAFGTLLCIANHVSYKCRNNPNIYKKNELESTFVEIVNLKKSNIIVGVIYRHLDMALLTLIAIN